MIDLREGVSLILMILAAGVIGGLLFFLADYLATKFPSEAMALAAKVAKVAIVVFAVLIAIGIILSFATGTQIFRWGGTTIR